MTFIYLGLAWHGGIALGATVAQPVLVWLALAAVGAAGAFVGRADRRARLGLALLAAAGLGAARYQAAQPDFSDPLLLATYNEQGVAIVEGVVIDEPDVRDTHTNLRVRVDNTRLPGVTGTTPVYGVVLARAPRSAAIGYGDRVRAVGDLQTPPVFEDFNYADFLARQGIYTTLSGNRTTRLKPASQVNCPQDVPPYPGEGALRTWLRCRAFDFGRVIFWFKAHALAAITHIFPEPQAALLSGILLGVESGIPPSLQEAFRRTGTSHIVAISGFNITIVSAVFLQTFRRIFGERWARPIAISAIVVYAVLAGADASVVRAALMGGLVIVANGLARPAAGTSALTFAALLMTIWNPNTLWDVGFQLSVAATLGLVLYGEALTNAAMRLVARFSARESAERVVGVLSEFTVLTLAAQLTTLPLIAFYFHEISLISFLANLLVLPVQPQVMIFGGVATLVELGRAALGLVLPLGQLAAWVAWPFVTFTIRIAETLAIFDWAVLPVGRFSLLALVGMYGLLFGVTWLLKRPPEERPEWWMQLPKGALPNLLLGALGIAVVALWASYLMRPDGLLHVTFLDVGQGDAVLIQPPSGRYVLLDGGPSPNRLAEALGRHMPFTAREIDLVVAANPGADGLGGLPGLFDRYAIGQVLLAVEPSQASAYRDWIVGVTAHEISIVNAEPGLAYDLGDGARLIMLHVGDKQTALQLDYGNARFLFTPQLTAASSLQLVEEAAIAPATVLLVPDHGGEDTLSEAFVETANPWAAVISVGAGNAQGDPASATLAQLAGRTILRTDQHGWVEFSTDGEQLWTRMQR